MRRNLTQEFLIEEYKKYAEHLESIYNERNRATKFFTAIATSPILLYLVNIYTARIDPSGSWVLGEILFFYLTLVLAFIVVLIGIGLYIQYIWNRFNYQEKLKHLDLISGYFKKKGRAYGLLTEPQKNPKNVYFSMRADFWLGFVFIIPNSFYLTVLEVFSILILVSLLTGACITQIVASLKYGGVILFVPSLGCFIGWVVAHICLKWRVLKSLEVRLIKPYGRWE